MLLIEGSDSDKVTQNVSEKKLTRSPNFSPLSEAILSETDIADIRLGCVHIILQTAPRTDSTSDSKMNCGICVVLPQPVAPEIITICKIQKVRLYCKS